MACRSIVQPMHVVHLPAAIAGRRMGASGVAAQRAYRTAIAGLPTLARRRAAELVVSCPVFLRRSVAGR